MFITHTCTCANGLLELVTPSSTILAKHTSRTKMINFFFTSSAIRSQKIVPPNWKALP